MAKTSGSRGRTPIRAESERKGNSPQTEHPSWKRFERLHCERAAMANDTLIALPRGFLAALRAEAPNLLTSEDVRLEEDLRRHSVTGFFQREPIFSWLLDRDALLTEEFEDDAFTENNQVSRLYEPHFISDALVHGVRSPHVMRQQHQIETQLRDEEHARLKGYAGWLVANSTFWADVAYLRPRIAEPPALVAKPQPNASYIWQTGRPRKKFQWGHLQSQVQEFLGRWSLQSMLTWELPEPVLARLRTRDDLPPGPFASTGVLLFLPWSLFADQHFSLSQLGAYHRKRQDLRHLSGWLDDRGHWGHDRFGQMPEFTVYLHQALAARYPTRLNGCRGAIDRTFVRFWSDRSGKSARNIEIGLDRIKKLKARRTKSLKVPVPGDQVVFFDP
jgi:hypothetical protein